MRHLMQLRLSDVSQATGEESALTGISALDPSSELREHNASFDLTAFNLRKDIVMSSSRRRPRDPLPRPKALPRRSTASQAGPTPSTRSPCSLLPPSMP